MKKISNTNTAKNDGDETTSNLFIFLCFWTFVLIGRPQDFLHFLIPFRPALILGIITALIYLLNYRGTERNLFFNNPQFKKYLALCIIMIISIPFALYRRPAFMFVFTKYSATVLYFYLFFIIVDSTKRLRTILFICCFGTFCYSFISLLKGDVIGHRIIYGGMFDPNDLAFFLISFLPFNFLFFKKESSIFFRVVCIVNLMLSLLVILMTGSRGGFLSLSAFVIMFFFLKTLTIRNLYKIVLGILCVILIFTNLSRLDSARYKTLFNIKADYNVSDEFGRVHIWKKGLLIMISNPLSGVGVTCFPEAIGTFRDKQGVLPSWQSAHNSLVQIGAETGIIGFILFALMSFNALKIFKRARRQSLSKDLVMTAEMASIGFICHFIGAMFLSQAYSLYWAFYIAFSAVIYRILYNETIAENMQTDRLKTS